MPVKIPKQTNLNLSDIIPDPDNPNVMTAEQEAALTKSLNRFGFLEPVIVGPKKNGKHIVYNGNHRIKTLIESGNKTVPAYIIKRPEHELKLLRQITNKLHGTHDRAKDKLELNLILKQESKETVAKHLNLKLNLEGLEEKEEKDANTKPKKPFRSGVENAKREETRKDLAVKYKVKSGDVWKLGKHKIICANSILPDTLKQLPKSVDVILTDPPYSSGGWQEATKLGKSSVGTLSAQPSNNPITNDGQSTRGYISMMKQIYNTVKAKHLFLFGDWKMWPYNVDTAEPMGYVVKNMLVWYKEGLGPGMSHFRPQHELIMWATSNKAENGKGSKTGNVFNCARSGNKHHPSEKPVPLLLNILSAIPDIKTVYDPFLGSGSTLLACEELGICCYGVESEPKHLATTISRWENLTSKKAQKAQKVKEK
ncbi:MAG: DNA methyltransferase [Thaumarchaeota archaeon]|nr:DNA methyltransferase [Nitrososphaerota archaeon]